MKDVISIGEFLSKYSFAEILVFVLLVFFAIKEGITFVDWCKGRIKKITNKTIEEKKEKEHIAEEIEDLQSICDERKGYAKKFETLQNQIEMLIESDKEDIKSFITSQHHFYVYKQFWIDDYSLECLERRFAIYEKEHGNSFVLGLMNEIRALPKRPPQEDEHRYVKTAEYIAKSNEKK